MKPAGAASDLAVATVTWARSAAEERLLRRALMRLVQAGLPVAVADRGTRRSFANFLRSRRDFKAIVEEGGLVRQVEASFRLVRQFQPRFVLYTEPDKEHFFERLSGFLEQARVGAIGGRHSVRRPSEAALVIAARSRRSFQTYPPTQRYTERVINHLSGERVGRRGDFSYGPIVFPHAFLRDLLPLPPDVGWGWRHYAFLRAHRRGLRIRHVIGDYPCPLDQRGEDDGERAHRLRQLSQNVDGLLA